MAFVGKPDVANQSPVWDGSKWITSFVSSSGGGSSTASGVPTTFSVVTASLTSSYSFPTQPNWSTLVSITSSWTDMMFWAKAAGECAGSNTIWLRLLIDSGSANATTGTFGNYTTFIETSTNGAGFGGVWLNGAIWSSVNTRSSVTDRIIPNGFGPLFLRVRSDGSTGAIVSYSYSPNDPSGWTDILTLTSVFTSAPNSGSNPYQCGISMETEVAAVNSAMWLRSYEQS